MGHTDSVTLCWATGPGKKWYIYFLLIISFSLLKVHYIGHYHPEAIGLFLVSVILGSDKTTVSVATSHTCYWLLYLSIGNIHDNVCHGH